MARASGGVEAEGKRKQVLCDSSSRKTCLHFMGRMQTIRRWCQRSRLQKLWYQRGSRRIHRESSDQDGSREGSRKGSKKGGEGQRERNQRCREGSRKKRKAE